MEQAQREFIFKLASVDSSKIEFICRNLGILLDLFLPVIQSKTFSESSSSPLNSQPSVRFYISDDDDESSDQNSSSIMRFISLDELAHFYDNHELIDRVLFSYSLVLHAFGWRLHSHQDGTVDRIGKTWKDVYATFDGADMNLKSSLVSAITRILRSLLDFRLRKIAKKFVQFIWEELCAGRLRFLRQTWEFVWVPMILVKGYYHSSEEQEDTECSWNFDESQRELWLNKLVEIEKGSSDDE